MKQIAAIIVFFALAPMAFATSHVTVELWTARWCRACPAAKQVAKELEKEGYEVTYKNFDKNRKEAADKGVSLLPTAIISVDEKVYLTLVGGEFTAERVKEIPVPEEPEEVIEPVEPVEPDYFLTKEYKIEITRLLRYLQSRNLRGR